jgi:uncharacterized protein
LIVVSNASPLMNLALINRLDLLTWRFDKVFIPPEVHRELTGRGMPGANKLKRANWIQVQTPQNKLLVRSLMLQVDRGEAEAITLALELAADLLLIDERKGRFVAGQLNVPIMGLLGLLVDLKQKGHLAAVKPVIQQLIQQANFWISSELFYHVLQAVGEDSPD